MPVADIVDASIALSDPPLGSLDFATPLIAADLTDPQDAAFGSDRTLVVTPQSWQSDLAALGIVSGEAVYVALSTLFAQQQRPRRAMLGRRLAAVAQVSRVAIVSGTYTGTFTVTINGIASTFAASSSSQDAVATGLRAAIQANTPVAAVVSAAGSGANVDVTADVPGAPFTITASGPAADQTTTTTTTANVGLPEDLAAFQAEDPSFYLVMETSRATPNLLALAAAIESFAAPKLMLGQSDDADANTSATTDLASQLQDLGYLRSPVCYHGDDSAWLDAALVGATLSQPAGSITFENRRVTGVVGAVYSSTTNLAAKRWTWLERFTAANFSMTRGGRVPFGHPIDLIIARDAILARIQTRGLEAISSAPKLPYTTAGASQLANYAVRATLLEFARAPYNVVVEDSIRLDVRPASEQSSTDRGNRHYPGIDWSATLQGAIDSITIAGTLSP